MKGSFTTAALASLFLIAQPASAATIVEGISFNVANGNHRHKNPPGKAEVGRWQGEIIKGLSEYNLAGLSNATSAFVTFDVFSAGGLSPSTNGVPFTGLIAIVPYRGNNADNLTDFSAPAVGDLGTFLISPESTSVGDVFSFDITHVFNNAIGNSWSSLGIRLEQTPPGHINQAWTFDNFRLTTNNQTTGAVPEPGTWAMLLLGFGVVGGAMRRKARTVLVRG